jgi:carbon storage regulator
MLVLSGKPGEQVVIGDGIVVTVTELSGGSVELGIEAPRTVSIRRTDTDIEVAGTSSKVRRKLLRRLSGVPR